MGLDNQFCYCQYGVKIIIAMPIYVKIHHSYANVISTVCTMDQYSDDKSVKFDDILKFDAKLVQATIDLDATNHKICAKVT